MFEDIELSNCPDNFALNCKNYQIKCFQCKGNNTSTYLLYKPINNSINNHPASIVQKSKSQSYSSKGRAKERFLITNISLLSPTKGSGVVLGDGDASLTLNGIGKIRVEIKSRFTSKTNIKPTSKELKEGRTQNINLFIIHNVIQNRTYFYITYRLFSEIWKVYIEKSWKFVNVELPLEISEYSQAYEVTPYYNSPTTWFKISNEFQFRNSKFGNKFYELNKLFIIKNKVGVYVGMHEATFNDLIDLYQNLTK